MATILEQSTQVADNIAKTMGGRFEQGKGFVKIPQLAPIDSTKPIVADRLTASPIPAIPPANNTSAQTSLAAAVGSVADNVFSGQQQEQLAAQNPAPAPQKNSLQDVLSRILTTSDKLGQKGPRSFEIQQEEGVFDKKAKSKALENEILSKTRAYDKQIQRAYDENPTGMLESGQNIKAAQIERQKNSELADLAIQYKVANDDYVGAFEIAQAKVDAEFEPLLNEIETLKTYYSLAQNDMTESEKLQAQAEIQRKEAEVAFGRQKELAAIQHKYGLEKIAYQESFEGAGGGLTADERKREGAQQRMLGLLQQYRQKVSRSTVIDRMLNPTIKSEIETLKGQITAEYKQAQQLGTLDAGVQKLVDQVIGDPTGLGLTSLSTGAQVAAIDNFIANQGGALTNDPLGLGL